MAVAKKVARPVKKAAAPAKPAAALRSRSYPASPVSSLGGFASYPMSADIEEEDIDSEALAMDVTDALSALLGKPRRAAKSSAFSDARSKVASALAVLEEDTASPSLPAGLSSAAPAKAAKAPAAPKAPPVLRPNGESYHPRTLAGMTDVEALRLLRTSGMNALLYGAPGCGKTALLEAAFGDQMVTFPGHGDAVVEELIGSWRPLTGGGYEWVDGPLVAAMEGGLVLFIDDATLTPSTVLARLYPAMDGRNEIVVREHDPRRTVKAKPGFCVVGAHNPGVPGAVLSEALASRFSLTVEIGTDYELAREIGVDLNIVRAAAHMDGLRRKEETMWAPQMRELIAYKRIKDILGVEAAVGNLLACAPVEDRDVLLARLTWVPDPAPLGLGSRA